MNPVALTSSQNEAAQQRVEFFRLPRPGKRDPHFGLSRAWYYKAAALGEIRMIAVRQRGALRGVRLVVYDSVADYIRRAGKESTQCGYTDSSATEPPASAVAPEAELRAAAPCSPLRVRVKI